MNRYSFFLCAALALYPPIYHSMHVRHRSRAIFRTMHTSRAVQTNTSIQQTADSAEAEKLTKKATLLFLKKACACTGFGLATFFAGHEWGKQKGFEEGFFTGNAHATAEITSQIAERAQAFLRSPK